MITLDGSNLPENPSEQEECVVEVFRDLDVGCSGAIEIKEFQFLLDKFDMASEKSLVRELLNRLKIHKRTLTLDDLLFIFRYLRELQSLREALPYARTKEKLLTRILLLYFVGGFLSFAVFVYLWAKDPKSAVAIVGVSLTGILLFTSICFGLILPIVYWRWNSWVRYVKKVHAAREVEVPKPKRKTGRRASGMIHPKRKLSFKRSQSIDSAAGWREARAAVKEAKNRSASATNPSQPSGAITARSTASNAGRIRPSAKPPARCQGTAALVNVKVRSEGGLMAHDAVSSVKESRKEWESVAHYSHRAKNESAARPLYSPLDYNEAKRQQNAIHSFNSFAPSEAQNVGLRVDLADIDGDSIEESDSSTGTLK